MLCYVGNVLVSSLALFLAGLAGQRLRAWRTDRTLGQGWLTCALKVTSGSAPGLSGRWRHVLARVTPGRFDCRGQWYRPGDIGSLTVTGISGSWRRPQGAEKWALSSDCRIVDVQTPTATLSWAILSRHIDGALADVTGDGHGHVVIKDAG